jgi:hypothetical protein
LFVVAKIAFAVDAAATDTATGRNIASKLTVTLAMSELFPV